jgi:2-keto-3-deoxy-L-rhamnonate aldolase RhmA
MGHRSVAVPDVDKAIDHVIARTKKARKWISLPAFDKASAEKVINRGADLVFISRARWLIEASQTTFLGLSRC